MTIIKKIAIACVALGMTAPVFAGGTAGGVEPGAGCEVLLGGAFSKVTGAPYSGIGNIYFQDGKAYFNGAVDQFGGSGGQMSTSIDNVIPGINTVADFEAIRAQDMRGFCIQGVEGGPTEFAEVLAARQLTPGPLNTATVEVILVPLTSSAF